MSTYLIQKKAKLNEQDDSGRTALMIAVENNYLNIVKLLIEKKADINIKDNYDKTALDNASDRGNIKIEKYLKGLGKK